MQAFVTSEYRNVELKSLNFIKKSIQPVTLADTTTADGNRISVQSYKGAKKRLTQGSPVT